MLMLSLKKLLSDKNLSLIIIILTASLFSCRNAKELIYVKNADNNEVIDALQEANTEYRVKPGDIMYVSIKSLDRDVNAIFNPEAGGSENITYSSHQKFSSPAGAYIYGFEVNKNGYIHLPILGEIDINEMTESEAEAKIQQYADKYIKEAVVKVKLLNYKVTVLGEVKSPGVYYNYNNNFTVLEAISMANGNTDYANINKVLVIRTLEDGKKKAIKLDLGKKETFISEAFYMQPNDYVFVEPDRYKNFQLNSQTFSLLFSSMGIMLAILGLVK
jgi:polysaccharide export outer membrane protein